MSGTFITFPKLTAFCHVKSLTKINSYLRDKFLQKRLICVQIDILLCQTKYLRSVSVNRRNIPPQSILNVKVT